MRPFGRLSLCVALAACSAHETTPITAGAACSTALLSWAELPADAPRTCAVADDADPTQCLTGEHLPANTEDDVRAKHDFLVAQLAAIDAGDRDARDGVIAAAKLLFERKGSVLTAAQRAGAIDLYRRYPSAEPSCGEPVPAIAAASSPAFGAPLSLCRRLGLPHGDPALAALVFDDCLAAAHALPAGAGVAAEAATAVLVRSLEVPLADTATARIAPATAATPRIREIQTRLARIHRWYQGMRTLLYPIGSDRAPLWGDLSEVAATFWKSTQGTELETMAPDALARITEAGLTERATRAMAIDRDVLAALFLPVENGTEPPLWGAPALLLMSDALETMRSRLVDFSGFHDLGCVFKGCRASDDPRTGPGPSREVKSEIATFWQVLAALGDATAMGNALAAVGRDLRGQDVVAGAVLDGPWKSLFDDIRAQHVVIKRSVLDALDRPTSDPTRFSPQDILGRAFGAVPPARAFASLAVDAVARAESYRRVGLFDDAPISELPLGIQESQHTKIHSLVTRARDDLDARVREYHQSFSTLLRDLVAQIGNAGNTDALSSKARHSGLEYLHQDQDLTGLQLSQELEEKRHADLAKGFEAAITSGAFDENMQMQTRTHRIAVSPRSARFQAGTTALSDLAVQHAVEGRPLAWKLEAGPGDVLNLEISGQWSPTCAMQKNTKDIPGATASRITHKKDGKYILTGPEGYTVTLQGSQYQAKGHEKVDSDEVFDSQTTQTKVCAGVKVEGGFDIGVASVKAYASVDACGDFSSGTRHSDTTTDRTSAGSESRISAAFPVGLRLPNTPMPTLPAGALILVEVPRGATSVTAVQDVHVLRPAATVVFDGDVDAYLIVNDLHDAGCDVDTQELTVSMSHTTPVGATVDKLGSALGAVITRIHDLDAPRIVGQGRMLPEDATGIRDAARSDVSRISGLNLSEYPDPIRGFFDAHVSYEIARIGRLVEIKLIERKKALLTEELAGITHERIAATEEGRLLRLLPQWTLRNLDADRLRRDTSTLVWTATEMLYPIIRLRYPKALDLVAADAVAQGQLENLIRVRWTASAFDVAATASSAVDSILKKVELAIPLTRGISVTNVFLRFPRPNIELPADVRWARVDADRTAAVWRAIDQGNGIATFPVKPEDLYRRLSGDAVLGCGQLTPVIRSVAMYVVTTGGDTEASSNWHVPMVSDESMTFVTPGGPLVYRMVDEAWTHDNPRVLVGPYDKLSERFENKVLRQGYQTENGLSPFTSFTADLSALQAAGLLAEENAMEIVLTFQLEKQESPPIRWLSVCQ